MMESDMYCFVSIKLDWIDGQIQVVQKSLETIIEVSSSI